jgi:hypothetical protein
LILPLWKSIMEFHNGEIKSLSKLAVLVKVGIA